MCKECFDTLIKRLLIADRRALYNLVGSEGDYNTRNLVDEALNFVSPKEHGGKAE